MPLKLFYNGPAVLYGERWGNPDALKKYRFLQNEKKSDWRYDPSQAWRFPELQQEKKRGFRLNFSQRQKIISSAKFGYDNKENKILFLTATFRAGEFDFKDDPLSHPNTVIVKWLDNLRHNYGAKGYAWTKELTEKNTPHYHILIDLPFNDIRELNKSFCKARGYYSANAVRHDKKNGLVVKSWNRAAGYAAKYITKCKDKIFSKRCYSIADKWQVPALVLRDPSEIKTVLNHSIANRSGKYSVKTDFAEIFTVNPDYVKEIFQSLG